MRLMSNNLKKLVTLLEDLVGEIDLEQVTDKKLEKYFDFVSEKVTVSWFFSQSWIERLESLEMIGDDALCLVPQHQLDTTIVIWTGHSRRAAIASKSLYHHGGTNMVLTKATKLLRDDETHQT
ncbi:hypothetical protein Hamer_G007759 [Homarus americanus]|uniref:Uncharacterized protein n=1 Tax=Homarus americanus TaxID=6706 RepID=A0A8J5MRR2_HOMAM|nr:hypothetical protein Hamer_G007759 [Homarus americanus]